MKKKEKSILIICICLLFLGIVFISLPFLVKNDQGIISSSTSISQIELFEPLDPIYEKYMDKINPLKTSHDNNECVVAQLIFESGLINETVVQGQSNDTYLRINYLTNSYDIGGSIFMDYRNTFSDQNIIIYGHYFPEGYNHEPMFTELHKLESEENYKDNKRILLITNNEVKIYEIAYVYLSELKKDKNGEYAIIKDNIYYTTINFDISDKASKYNNFDSFINNLEKKKLYDTGVKIDSSDKFLTLQTCCDDPSKRLVVIAKQIEKLSYSLPTYIDYLLKNNSNKNENIE